jgi:hypothetical protein
MRRVHHDEAAGEQLALDLDEIARQGAKKMLAQALEAEVDAYLKATAKHSATSAGVPWLPETATPTAAKCSAGLGPSRLGLRGSTIGGWTSKPASG